MKRLALLLAGTAMPIALLAAPDFVTRAFAQSPPQSIEVMLEEAGLDGQALEQLESDLAEAQERAAELREQADALAERAAASAEEASAARNEAEALAGASDADPDAIEAARAAAEEAAARASEDEQAASQARDAAEAAENEVSEIRERFETAQREAQELRERAAQAEAEAEAAREAEAAAEQEEAEREEDARRKAEDEAAAEAEPEAEASTDAEAETKAEAEAGLEAETEAAVETEAEGEPEAEAQAEREAPREEEEEAEVEAEAATEIEGDAEAEASPTAEPERERERGERRRDRDAAETAPAPATAEEEVAAPEPENFGEVREGRRERTEDGVTITEESGARTIIEEGARMIIRQAEDERVRRTYSDVRRERRGDQEVLIAPREGNVEIITILDTEGNLVRRIRREADGTETVLIDNTRRERADRDRRGERRDERRSDRRDDPRDGLRFGFGEGALSFSIDIAPPEVRMPRERYVVEYGDVYEEDLVEVFSEPPVAELDERYSLDEVRYNPNLRDYMPRVDLDTVTFDTGSWGLSPGQIDQLGRVAGAMNEVIDRSPDEIFLIEGHTDAVGRAIDNLSLSDRRAESVAYLLTRFYDVPPENLVTQGYGEEFLKINTQEAERRNRRVTIRRITPLISQGPRG